MDERLTELHARITGFETAFVLLVRALEDGCCISASRLSGWLAEAERDARRLNELSDYVAELQQLRQRIDAATNPGRPAPAG